MNSVDIAVDTLADELVVGESRFELLREPIPLQYKWIVDHAYTVSGLSGFIQDAVRYV